MKNWFKTFGNDFSKPEKFDFFQKYILPALAVFFLWGFLANLYLTKLDKNSLLSNEGTVESINKVLEQGKYKHSPLIINLTNSSKAFRLPDMYKEHFGWLQHEIQTGDTITIYTRQRFQSLLSWGKSNDIYQIDKNGLALFRLSDALEKKKNQMILFGIFGGILVVWYVSYRRIRYLNSSGGIVEKDTKGPT